MIVSLTVAKVDLNVGLLSEKEKASMGVMVAAAGKLAAALHRRKHMVTSALATGWPDGDHGSDAACCTIPSMHMAKPQTMFLFFG